MSDTPVTIFYFGNDWFAENRTSSHHVARQLARHHQVIYVECPGLRPPQSSRRDLKKILVKLWRFVRGPKEIGNNITLLTLPQFPMHRFQAVRTANRMLAWFVLRLLMICRRVRNPLLWFVVPHPGHLCGSLGELGSVYYCIDDYAAFPNMDVQSIQDMDDELTRKANLVFVASETLLDAKRLLNSRVYHSPHGVDIEHFAQAAENSAGMAMPDDLKSVSQPVVGFFGLIESWIDLDLVTFLARNRPQYSFVMIGRIAVPTGDLPTLPNIFFLGRKSYEELPAYGRFFRCCMIPYRLNRQVMHANPLKLREYLAMGKPCVAVSTPEMEKFRDVVGVARDFDDFLIKLDEAITEQPNSEASNRRISRVADMSWESRAASAWETAAQVIPELYESIPTRFRIPIRGTG